jgi:mevalonate kinase
MKVIKVSVPGKVILMGDHAVVYGKPAIIAAINKRLVVAIHDEDKFTIISNIDSKYIRHCVDIVLHNFAVTEDPKISIEIQSEIPVGYHLGSSAAVAAGIVGALTFYIKKIWNPQLINQLAYECEKMIHGNPSGVDPATVVSGGLVWYRKELEFLRSIWQLPFSIPDGLNNFYLIDTGRSVENTGEIVNYVRSQFTVNGSRYEKIFSENEIQTKRLTVALKENNETELIDAIQKGQRTLEAMGAVSQKVIPLISEIEKSGGAAKILGGGGRKAGVGFLLCYHSHPKKLSDDLRKQLLAIKLGESGIRLEQ